MNIRELSQPITSKKLNESLSKQFGYKINLEQFTDVQLEDARNKLRTKMSQFELSESFDAIHESPDYQKTRMFLDVLNQELLERDESEEVEEEIETEEDEPKSKKETQTESYMSATIRQRAHAARIPAAWINSAISRMDLGESERSELSSELTLRYDLSESQASYILAEGEEKKAATIMATKDMVDKITGWLEDVAAMKAETLLELLDSIREESGSDVAQRYQDAVKPALEALYTTLESTRGGLSGALAVVSGGEAPSMGAPVPGMGEPAPADLGAEIGGADIAAPTPEMGAPSIESGREKRESVDYSRRLGMLLNSKKK